ncbi:MAG: hypothetical protein P8J20_08305 [Novosphingobium sp.]|nr:hypothetical protein [Novosphingobium sp.]
MEAHLANRLAHPELPIMDLRFEHIVGNLPAMLDHVYEYAGLELKHQSRERMLAWNAENTMHKLGEFSYSLADAGLDEAAIRERMAGYFKHLENLSGETAPAR